MGATKNTPGRNVITAEELIELKRTSVNLKYGILLRSFRRDARIHVPNHFNIFRFSPIGFGLPMLDAQKWIMRAATDQWRFVAWGGKAGHVRPPSVRSDDSNWFKDVKEVGVLADVIAVF